MFPLVGLDVGDSLELFVNVYVNICMHVCEHNLLCLLPLLFLTQILITNISDTS